MQNRKQVAEYVAEARWRDAMKVLPDVLVRDKSAPKLETDPAYAAARARHTGHRAATDDSDFDPQKRGE